MAKKITIVINTENAAFEGSRGAEIARILREMARDWDNGKGGKSTYNDINGNKVATIIENA